MSIIRMKRLRVIAMDSDRRELLRELQKLGCVEISNPSDSGLLDGASEILKLDEPDHQALRSNAQSVKAALDALSKYAPVKKGIFAPKAVVGLEEIFDEGRVAEALDAAVAIHSRVAKIAQLHTEEGRLLSRRASLLPWSAMDVPFDLKPFSETEVMFGVAPVSSDIEALKASLEAGFLLSALYCVGQDREQHYLMFICHRSELAEATELLKGFGFSRVQFKDYEGDAKKNLHDIDSRILFIGSERERLIRGFSEFDPMRAELELCFDALNIELEKELARDRVLRSRQTFIFEGWTPAREIGRVKGALESLGCAYEYRDPEDGESPPVSLYNSKMLYPFNMVTEMYSMPAYDGIDPNPLMGPFFAIFFGIMYADVGYGLILLAISLLLTKKAPVTKGGLMEKMFSLLGICGVSTIIFGLCFGSFFGDVVTTFSKYVLNMQEPVVFPALLFGTMDAETFIPGLSGPLLLLFLTLGLGVVQIIFGMAINAYLLIRDGHIIDAIFDVGSWWLLFAGLVVLALGGTYWVALAGTIMLVLTQGRSSKSVIGKIMGGLGSLYNITGYLSDVLSYSRLMALCMATGVIASVFNILGGMAGPIAFWIVFLIGHAFNMGINIIGTYVHAARLQYLEFFTKWYREGGRRFSPLSIKTKFVSIVREEK